MVSYPELSLCLYFQSAANFSKTLDKNIAERVFYLERTIIIFLKAPIIQTTRPYLTYYQSQKPVLLESSLILNTLSLDAHS